jgi:lipopolysaccharide biosynthesis glycosyltransferase
MIGARALRNSWVKNSPHGFDFHVIGYGDEAFERELRDEFDNVIFNPDIGANLPCSYKCTTPNPAMYARLLIPELYSDHERSIYIDADAVILKPLDGLAALDMKNYPVAGIPSWCPIEKEVIGHPPGQFGIMTALMVFNHSAWIAKDILNQCRKAMDEEPYHFKTVVQAVMQYVLKKDWLALHKFAQVQYGHATTVKEINNAYVLHFAGTNPWEPYPAEWPPQPKYKDDFRALWASYL